MRTEIQCRRDHARRPCDHSSVATSSECCRQPRRRRTRRRPTLMLPWPQVLLVILAVLPTVGLGVGVGLRAKRAIRGVEEVASTVPGGSVPVRSAIAQSPALAVPKGIATQEVPPAAPIAPL